MRFKTFLALLMLVTGLVWFSACAGSREEGDEDFFTEEEKQQKELDDIEALLGITPTEEESSTQKKPGQKQSKPEDSEKLSLLDEKETLDTSQPMMAPTEEEKLQERIDNLESELRQKDKVINNLNAELQQQKSSPAASSGGYVGQISMAEYETRYNDARAEFENRNYQVAIELFESLLAASTSHSLADNAQYWIGECHYQLRQYDAAILDFEKVFTFGKSNKDDDAQFKLGLCYIRKGDRQKAREELDRLIQGYPDSEYVSQAERLLSQM